MNSRAKGARGERQWRDELRAQGYTARRGQQFFGSAESPDVVCPDLDFIHWEVKAVEKLNIEAAMEQARRDGAGKVPILAHKRSHRRWLVTMDAETFFKLLRGDLPPVTGNLVSGETPDTTRKTRELPLSAAADAAANNTTTKQ